MKVVLFCGGLGLRLRDYADQIPKPMVSIGYRPILWNVMKYFAHFGHRDFILCLGYRGDLIKQYFLNYSECVSNDFVLSDGGRAIELASSDINDWRISFADTGLRSNIGQRLMAVKKIVIDEDVFLASYTDGLTDLDLGRYLDYARERDKMASFVSVKPNLSYHIVQTGPGGLVTGIRGVRAIRHSNQCRIFRFEEANFQIHTARRGACSSAFPTPDPRKTIDHL